MKAAVLCSVDLDLTKFSETDDAIVPYLGGSCSALQGNFTYMLLGFAPGSTHTIRLHFVELCFTAVGARASNISINGAIAVANYDIVAAAGDKNKAVIRECTEKADSTGAFVVNFTSVVNSALLSAIEIK